MVSELSHKFLNFKNAHSAFAQAIETQQKFLLLSQEDENLDNLLSAGVIQHFELAYETLWKFLKEYLKYTYEVEVNSPRETFRACYEHKVLPESLVSELIQLADARNKTTHVYNQILAREICNDVVKHHHAMKNALEIVGLVEKIAV